MNNSYIVDVDGQKLKITDVEFLFSYENENKEKFIVFEYCGQKYESKINE